MIKWEKKKIKKKGREGRGGPSNPVARLLPMIRVASSEK